MKTKIGILILVLCATFFNSHAQRVVTTTQATSYDISENLDLEAVASVFGDSKDLEDFEYRLNDPKAHISNLDLNEDGYVDYLRVVESNDNGISEVVIQAVLGDEVFQDVATIDVQKVRDGNPRIQIVGDPFIYGNDYIFEPVYYRTPLIFNFFLGLTYRPWHSPYYWGYYPSRFHFWQPLAINRYHRNIYSYSRRNSYNFTMERHINFSGDAHNKIRRNDYALKFPNRSFDNRNQGVKNKVELNRRRPSNIGNVGGKSKDKQIQRQSPTRVKSSQGTNVRERSRPVSNQQPNQVTTPSRSNNSVEIKTNNKVAIEKTVVKSTRNSSNNQVKPNLKNEKNPISAKKESRKEKREKRRSR